MLMSTEPELMTQTALFVRAVAAGLRASGYALSMRLFCQMVTRWRC